MRAPRDEREAPARPRTHHDWAALVSADAATRWDRVIPHYALTAGLRPKPGASWDELVYFAGTFDGYVVFPELPAFSRFVVDGRAEFTQHGTLPEGLTMLRTALHGEQRDDYWSDNPSPSEESIRYAHALSASASSSQAAHTSRRSRGRLAVSVTRS
jgi:hypothetical protein